jgi:hypothetical protein
MANIKMDIDKAKESCCIIMHKNTRVIGKLIRDMVLVSKSSQTEAATKGITCKIGCRVRESISGLEVRSTRVSLRIISSMVLGCGLMLREILI